MSEARRDARRAAFWVGLGILGTACAGGPVIGFVSGLFWARTGGGYTEGAAADRIEADIYGRNHIDGDHLSFDVPAIGSCKSHMKMREIDTRTGRIDVTGEYLNRAIAREEERDGIAVAEQISRNAIGQLSYPVLGALEGCISRSLLAPLCEAEVLRIKQSARRKDAGLISANEAKSDADWREVWCVVDRHFGDRISSDLDGS